MNKYQRLVVIVAVIDLLVMILFPPFNGRSLVKGTMESFDGFYSFSKLIPFSESCT